MNTPVIIPAHAFEMSTPSARSAPSSAFSDTFRGGSSCTRRPPTWRLILDTITERERVGILALADDTALADTRQLLELDIVRYLVLAITSSVLNRRSGTDAPIAANRLVYDRSPGEPSAPPSNAIQCSPLPTDMPHLSIHPSHQAVHEWPVP
jgi:hypothetical protein